MAVIGYLEGEFVEAKSCSNPKYFMASFNFPVEVYGKVMTPAELDRPPVTRILCESPKQQDIANLKMGEKYKLMCSFGVSKANESNGKVYPASLNISIVKVL